MSTFRDKFSPDYLRRAGSESILQTQQENAPASAALSSDMEEAVLAWGGKVASVLNAAPDKRAKIFDILNKLDLRIDVLIPVIDHLAERGYVTKIEQDKKGNDLLGLTERGQKLV
jgi:hypothetical protein